MASEVIRIIKERRSVREYLPRHISKEVLEDIVDCGRLAPSARNLQPWLFVVSTEKTIKEEIAKLAVHGRFIANAAACISVFCERENNHPVEDGSAATQNILIAAKAHGIDSCWVAGYKKEHSESVREFLGVPQKYMLISLIALGYSDKTVNKPKKALSEVIRWEKY
ncbi:MAG TPA: nitroreductase family protein [Thermoanaerobacterales bacterium]|jgi:nitroreductase|nr:nitroreductase family protein [Thermoanaerobacterales bacterium]